ncbi:MAG: hypothetical protein ACJ73J_02460 [Actinomycetes bacterium]
MSRGRHSLPEPPRSPLPIVLLGLVLVIAALGAVWLVDDSWVVEVGVTGVVVILALTYAFSVRSSHQMTSALWHEAMERRHEAADVHRELNQLRAQHVELLLELRSLRVELAAASEETARSVQAATDQRAIMHELLAPRQPVADPVYPSMHLPLVRAAFSADVPSRPPAAEVSAQTSYPDSDDTGGSEPFPPRQLLDLTASEIARLRPAN